MKHSNYLTTTLSFVTLWQAALLCGAKDVGAGLTVIAGGDGRPVMEWQQPEASVIHYLTNDRNAVEMFNRQLITKAKGGVVSASWFDGATLPYCDNLVNTLIVEADLNLSEQEILRVLAPGGTASLGGKTLRKERPAEIDEWTHYFRDATNNAVSRDQVVGSPVGWQWHAKPLTQRSHNWTTSTHNFISAANRVFYMRDEGPISVMSHRNAGMNWASDTTKAPDLPEKWLLICRDAFNGILLWKRELTGFGQFEFEDVGTSQPTLWNIWASPLSLQRRLVAKDDRVYATLAYRGGVTALNAADGQTVWEYRPTEYVDEIILADGKLFMRLRQIIPAKRDQPFGTKPAAAANMRRYSPEEYTKYVEDQPDERIAALDAANGKLLWSIAVPRVATESLCALDGGVCYYDGKSVVCVEAADGKERWRSVQERVIGRGGSYGRSGGTGNLFLWDGRAYFNAKSTVCLSLNDGAELWRSDRLGYSAGFGHPTGLRVVQGRLINDNLNIYDAKTGESLGQLTTPALGGTHSRCHRGIATERFLCGIRFGIEFYDLAAKKMVSDNRWLRSACATGYIPANGFLHNLPDPCACWMGARVRGINAFAAQAPSIAYEQIAWSERLEHGPAFNRKIAVVARTGDWPVYRRDSERSGRASTTLPTELSPLWTARIGGVLSPPIIAGGRVYVSRKSHNEMLALDADNGNVLWQRRFASFVDSPPTYADGRLFFGCADGRVHALDAADGAVLWTFLAAPADILMMDDGRLASKWPVHGSLVVQDGFVFGAAGRSSFLDGGIFVFKLEADSGKFVASTRISGPAYDFYAPNPVAPDDDTETKVKGVTPLGYHPPLADIEGALGDLWASDGRDFHMGSTRITPELEWHSHVLQQAAGESTGGRRLRPIGGFLDDSYFQRVGWHYSDTYYGGGNAAGAANAGKILVFDEQFSYGAQWEGQGAGRYPNHLIGDGTRINCDRVETANVQKGFEALRKAKPVWSIDTPLIIRAMLLAPGREAAGVQTLFIAGPLENGPENDPLASYEYRTPAVVWAMSADQGAKLAEWPLEASPIFDGLAAANERLFFSLVNGQVVCLGPR